MKLILLGAPGSGKGTVSECLEQEMKFLHVSAGELLREEIAKGTSLGKEIHKYVDKGLLVPTDLVVDIVKLEVLGKEHYVLDGFPRSLEQAHLIEDLKIDAVISLDVPEAVVIERLSGRRACQKCGAGYHVKYIPPKKAGICDRCGSKLEQRKDDNPETIKQRFQVYHKETQPLVEFYVQKKMLHGIDASLAPDKVCKSVVKQVKKLGKN
jgi:adenylate kinase